ncbi:MAG: methyltransferase domain-containing protein [Acidimicrobiia bacterium]|nr:methyltransferase domain-containing protein [Acidimicrobiia bacterium]
MANRTDKVERWSSFKVWLFSLGNRNPESNPALVDYAGLGSNDRFLDVGCGLGTALEHAARTGAEIAGVDPSPAMVERASKRVPQAEVKVGSAETIPFPDGHFTVVGNIKSYHHWANPDAGLAEILRVLVPGGRLLIAEKRLKRNRGHGLHPEQADELARTLLGLGYATSTVDSLSLVRNEFLVVSGVAS